jgi:hypothetical protein
MHRYLWIPLHTLYKLQGQACHKGGSRCSRKSAFTQIPQQRVEELGFYPQGHHTTPTRPEDTHTQKALTRIQQKTQSEGLFLSLYPTVTHNPCRPHTVHFEGLSYLKQTQRLEKSAVSKTFIQRDEMTNQIIIINI